MINFSSANILMIFVEFFDLTQLPLISLHLEETLSHETQTRLLPDLLSRILIISQVWKPLHKRTVG